MARIWIVTFAMFAAGCGALGGQSDLGEVVNGIDDDPDWIAVPASSTVDVTPAANRTLVFTDFRQTWNDGVESARTDIAGPCDARCSAAVGDDIERRTTADQLDATVDRGYCDNCGFDDYLEVAEFSAAGVAPLDPDTIPPLLGSIDTAFEVMLVVGTPGWAQADGDAWRFVYPGPTSSCTPWTTRWFEVSVTADGQVQAVAEHVDVVKSDKEICV